MTDNVDSTKINEQRMQVFARFFKGYMGTAPIIAAALPIPVTALKLIPTYPEQTGYLTTYTSMFCFLTVALIFYRRHRLGSYLLPETWEKKSRIIGRFITSWLPLFLLFVTLFSIVVYHTTLNLTLERPEFQSFHMSVALERAQLREQNYWVQTTLILSYFGIFIPSTAAFALMAVREYMQDVLGLSEVDLVLKSADPFTKKDEPI